MPQFDPSSTHTALVTMSNPTGAAFDYASTLYLGVNMVAMASASFHLEAGEAKDISFPVIMPTAEGTYPVYLDAWSGETLLGHYKAIEDVVIVSVPVVPILAGEIIEIMWRVYGEGAWRPLSEAMPAETYVEHRFKIKNTGNALTTFNVADWSSFFETYIFTNDLITIPPGAEGYAISAFGTGLPKGTFSHTWYLFAVAGETTNISTLLWRDATLVHSKTVLVTVV